MILEFSPAFKGPSVLVLGMFDGVHMGHRQLIRTAMGYSHRDNLPLTVCTFQVHPLQVLYPEKAPKLLSTLPERAGAMASLHVDRLCILPFTKETANETPDQFISFMVKTFQPKHIIVGFNYSFGVRGEGNCDTLKAAQAQYGFEVHVVAPVMEGEETVSSTRIRKLLGEGNVEKANQLMGRAYAISGRVADGKHIGRTMGFPTANIALPRHKVVPAFGVYAAALQVEGEWLPAVVNVGCHPTLPKGAPTIEAHLLGKSMMLYGKKVVIHFLHFHRKEQTFESMDALKAQIAADAKQAEAFFQSL